MEQKIKNSFNTVNIPVFPTSEQILNKVSLETNKEKIYRFNKLSFVCVTILVLICLSVPFILLGNKEYLEKKQLALTPRIFNSVYNMSYTENDDGEMYLKIYSKLEDAIYQDVKLTISYFVNDGELINEEVKTIFINNEQEEVYLCSTENKLENLTIVSVEGNVEIDESTFSSISNEQKIIDEFYKKLEKYNLNNYIFSQNKVVDYYEVDYDDDNDVIECVNDDFIETLISKVYIKDQYLRYEYHKLKNAYIDDKNDYVLMNYQDRACLIKNLYNKSLNGKYAIELDFYDSFDSAKNYFYKYNTDMDINSLITLVSENNLNLSQIDLENVTTTEQSNNGISIYKLTGLFKYFYLLDEKICDTEYIYEKTYKKFLDKEIELIITMEDGKISLNIDFEVSDDIYGYVTNRPLYSGEKIPEDKLQVVEKFEYALNLEETFEFKDFNENEFDNFVDKEDVYSYKPSYSIEDVYQEIKPNEDIHIEYHSQLQTSYFKIYLTKGQYYLHDYNSYHRDVMLFDIDGNIIDLGVHNNNVYFGGLSSTFVVLEDGYYFIAIGGNSYQIDFSVKTIEDETYYDLSNVEIITEGEVHLHFDTNYDIHYYNYYSNESGILEVSTSDNLCVYSFNPLTNTYDKFNNNTVSIQKGNNLIAFAYYPLFELKYETVDTSVELVFLGSMYGYSSEIENMPIITNEFFNDYFYPTSRHSVYLKMNLVKGKYQFIIDGNVDYIELFNLDGTLIGTIENGQELTLEEDSYYIEATSYSFTKVPFNIRYEYLGEFNFDDYIEYVEYCGGDAHYEKEFSTDITSMKLVFDVTFDEDYVVNIVLSSSSMFKLEIYDLDNNRLFICDNGNKFTKGEYRFVFIAASIYYYKVDFSISEYSNCKDPHDVVNSSNLKISNSSLEYNNSTFINTIDEKSVSLYEEGINGARRFIVLCVTEKTEVTVTNFDTTINVRFNIYDVGMYRLSNTDTSIILEEGIYLLEIKSWSEDLNLKISVSN